MSANGAYLTCIERAMKPARQTETKMTTFNIFANGTFWGEFTADTEEEAIKAAADEFGTEGNTEGMAAKEAKHTMKDLDAAAMVMDDEIREEMHSEGDIDTADEFIAEYAARHAEKFDGEEFSW